LTYLGFDVPEIQLGSSWVSRECETEPDGMRNEVKLVGVLEREGQKSVTLCEEHFEFLNTIGLFMTMSFPKVEGTKRLEG
jgi:hypothetical protein